MELREEIEELVRQLVITQLSIWDGRTDFKKLIDKETDKFMDTIERRGSEYRRN